MDVRIISRTGAEVYPATAHPAVYRQAYLARAPSLSSQREHPVLPGRVSVAPEAPVETLRRLIPRQHVPPQSTAAARSCVVEDSAHQRRADAPTATVLRHEQFFEYQRRPKIESEWDFLNDCIAGKSGGTGVCDKCLELPILTRREPACQQISEAHPKIGAIVLQLS